MLFLSFAFGAWAIFYHTSASAIRVEEARTERDTRSTWTAPAIAQGLRLLESGPPPSDPYSCKVTVASDSDTQYILLTYDQISTGRYKITAVPTTADNVAPSAPTSFLPLPSAPATLTATAASSTQINLTWTDVFYESGYLIERSADGSTGWTQIGTASENATNYTDTGLTPATTYYYRVHGTNVTGNGAYSPIANATTMQIAPPAPTGMTATAVSSSEIDLSWNDVATETGYLLERSPDGSSGWTQVNINAANVTTFADTGLAQGTTYYYRVHAFNLAGNSAYSSVASATTSVNPPAAPTALIASAASTTEIDLSWTDNSSNESGFNVERSPDGSTWTQINTTAANATSYADTGLSGNTTYYYRVRATNAGGDSSYTSTANATTLPPAPAVPSGLGATAASSTEIDLTWTDNSSNDNGFKIERSPDGSTWAQINTVNAGVTSYSDTGLSPSTQFYYRVRAYNAGGNSAFTSSAVATTLVSPPAAPLSGLGRIAAINSSEIDIHWTDNSSTESGLQDRSIAGRHKLVADHDGRPGRDELCKRRFGRADEILLPRLCVEPRREFEL